MDLIKFGTHLKNLRNQRGLTQEVLAEDLGVSSRTISRWETGTNIPDLQMLLIIANHYGLEIGQMLNYDEEDTMDKNTAQKMADYSNEVREKFKKRVHILMWLGLIGALIYVGFQFTGFENTPLTNLISDFVLGFAIGMLLVGIIFTSKHADSLAKAKAKFLKK